jgi:hypothetical protein
MQATFRYGQPMASVISVAMACCILACCAEMWSPAARAQSDDGDAWLSPAELREKISKAFAPPKECRALHPNDRIWIHKDQQAVVVDGFIAQRQAPLEMFACPAGTKEHESVVSVFAKSRFVHAGLLAVGGKPGSPAKFEPFRPATGTTVRIHALWFDEKGEKQSTIAQKWVRKMGTKENLTSDWVFGGSGEYVDEATKERHYMADSGELVCVANFGTSTLDIVVRSDQGNSILSFDTYTERIPKRNTPVRLVFVLSSDKPHGASPEDSEKEPEFLSQKTPDFVMNWLEAPSSADKKGAPAASKEIK